MNNQNSFLNQNQEDYKEKYNQNNYSRSLYNKNNNYFDDEKNLGKKKDKGSIIMIIIVVILLLSIVGFGIYLFTRESNKEKDITINFLVEEITITEGDNSIISYSTSGTTQEIPMEYESSNEDIAIVNSKGKVFGLKEGNTRVRVTYIINGVKNTKDINVIVTKKK